VQRVADKNFLFMIFFSRASRLAPHACAYLITLSARYSTD
jgi:hypothetical protein